jgi:hypothetical protein
LEVVGATRSWTAGTIEKVVEPYVTDTGKKEASKLELWGPTEPGVLPPSALMLTAMV